ncbi:gamma-glutamylcyclotransferase-like [Glandiceps talaboti]
MSSAKEEPSTFMYMAYGSNLLKERLHINSPSAKYIDVAKLENYKLTFATSTKYNPDPSKRRWGAGGVATIVESPGDVVWGTIWEIGREHLPALDRQEGVHMNVYDPLEVTVCTQNNRQLTCRTYKMVNIIPTDPSPHYLSVVQDGAKQNGLPDDYITFLNSIQHNNYQGELKIMAKIEENKKSSDS